MRCSPCGVENPKQSKFCRKCGKPVGVHLKVSKGATEEKHFIREKHAEGLTVEQVIELVDQKYGHRI